MTTLTWTSISTTQPGWSLMLGTFSQPTAGLSLTQSVSNWQYPEVLTAYGQGGRTFLGYCQVFIGNPSGDCTVSSVPDGTGVDYTLNLNLGGIDMIELGAYGATGFPSVKFEGQPTGSVPEPATMALMPLALAIAYLVARWRARMI